ncbi:MAG: cation transporter [Flavobacterium sp.]|nr:cation transporter [Flavobacterium sp.]
MKKIITIVLLVFVGFSTQAQVKKNKNAKYVTEVNGNCEQCQKRIQKAAFGVEGVKSAIWNIESHQLTVILNEEKCSLLDVKKAIAKVGHDTVELRANDEVYNNLHHCCLYDRDDIKKSN